VTNPAGSAVLLTFQTFGPGGALTCAPIDTAIHIRNAAGTSLALSDDDGGDLCSLLSFSIAAGATVYVHVSAFGDNTTVAQYYLQIAFP